MYVRTPFCIVNWNQVAEEASSAVVTGPVQPDGCDTDSPNAKSAVKEASSHIYEDVDHGECK